MKSFFVLLFISSLAQANVGYQTGNSVERLSHHQERDNSKHSEQSVCHKQAASKPCDRK